MARKRGNRAKLKQTELSAVDRSVRGAFWAAVDVFSLRENVWAMPKKLGREAGREPSRESVRKCEIGWGTPMSWQEERAVGR